MFVVIFRAKPKTQDETYTKTVARMRALAFEKYGCLDFVAATDTGSDGEQEVAISYWESEAAIRKWKQDSEHLLAQESGRANWYESYTVQVLELKREYSYSVNESD